MGKLFLDALGRPIDRFSLAAFLGQMGHGFTRAMVATEILGSVEFDQRIVQQIFQRLLRRAATARETAGYVQVLQNAIKEEVVVDSVVGSDEYFALAQH